MLLAWLALFLGMTARAADIPDCARLPGEPKRDQPSLADVMDCQKATRAVWNALDPRPSSRQWDRLDAKQRAEAKAYMDRHPDAAQQGAKKAAKDDAGLGGLTEADLKRVDDPTAQALLLLQDELHDQADGGRKGIDPKMGQEIGDFLDRQQGAISPDMAALLEAVTKDGPKLSAGTMKKLQEAARQAKGAGLDLNIDPKVEKDLLEKELPQAAPAAPPGSM